MKKYSLVWVKLNHQTRPQSFFLCSDILQFTSPARRQSRSSEKNQICRTVVTHNGGPPSITWVATLSLWFVRSSFRLWISWVLVTLVSLGQIWELLVMRACRCFFQSPLSSDFQYSRWIFFFLNNSDEEVLGVGGFLLLWWTFSTFSLSSMDQKFLPRLKG